MHSAKMKFRRGLNRPSLFSAIVSGRKVRVTTRGQAFPTTDWHMQESPEYTVSTPLLALTGESSPLAPDFCELLEQTARNCPTTRAILDAIHTHLVVSLVTTVRALQPCTGGAVDRWQSRFLCAAGFTSVRHCDVDFPGFELAVQLGLRARRGRRALIWMVTTYFRNRGWKVRVEHQTLRIQTGKHRQTHRLGQIRLGCARLGSGHEQLEGLSITFTAVPVDRICEIFDQLAGESLAKQCRLLTGKTVPLQLSVYPNSLASSDQQVGKLVLGRSWLSRTKLPHTPTSKVFTGYPE